MTHSAPVHNMYAERVLGMTDHNVHRAPNAKMDFVDSKVRFVVNKTCEWVDVQDESVVDFARKRAGKQAKERDSNYNILIEEKNKRLNMVHQVRDRRERNKIERNIKDLVDNHSDVRTSEVAEGLDSDTVDMLTLVVRSPQNIVNRKINHTWFDDTNQHEVIYAGRIVKVKKSKKQFCVAYWNESQEDEDAAEDYDVKITQVATDLIMGELIFVVSEE